MRRLNGPPMSPQHLPGVAMTKGIRPLALEDWTGKTAVVIGNGTSLAGRDLSILRREGVFTMVANVGYRLYPEADVLMCSDRHWLFEFSHDLAEFKGRRIVITRPEGVTKVDPRMRFVRREYIERWKGDIFSRKDILVEGHTSTSTNISLAVLQGVSRIILLGIDLRPGPDGLRRAGSDLVDDAAKAKARYDQQVVHLTMQSVPVLKRKIQVFNCSPQSSLTCYPYARLEDVLC